MDTLEEQLTLFDSMAILVEPMTRVLVVDDNVDNVALLATILRAQNFEVETCYGGVEALEAVAAHPPSLILLDVMMPGLDGYEVAARIKANPDLPFIPIILVTAKNELSDKIYGLEQGADDFLSKPVNAGELLARVRALLRLKAAQDNLQQKHQELSAVNMQLKQSEELREELVHMITHDLRGPLTGLVGALELMEDGTLGKMTAQQMQFVHLALNNCNTLSNMVGDLLDVYRIESGRAELEREPLEPKALSEAIISQYSAAATEKRITLINAIAADLPPVSGDRELLLRVFSNLMSNAFKYTPEGQITLAAARYDGRTGPFANGKCPPPAPSILFSIADTGAGIPEEAREHIFEKFYRVKGRRSGKHIAGHGLGLNFCKQVVEAHGGCIWVEGGPNDKGSSFNFTLPIA